MRCGESVDQAPTDESAEQQTQNQQTEAAPKQIPPV
jgi:hypothetical protein